MIPVKNKSISIIVPVFNSESILPLLCDRLLSTLNTMNTPYELIFVEDCSQDNSWAVIKSLASSNSRISGIKLIHNYGQHSALLCGIRAAKNDLIVTIDDDLQNPPEEIPKLIEHLHDGQHDVVYGYPLNESRGFLRKQASVFTKLALKQAMGVDSACHVSAFRVFHRNIKDAFAHYHSSSTNIDVLLTWGASDFSSIQVQHDPRQEGKSGYSIGKLLTHAFNMITGFSTLPLKVASYLGFAFSAFGLFMLTYVLGNYFFHLAPVTGFTFLASAIAIFSGVQLLALGVIGEYLARIHLKTMEKPTYSIKETT